MFDDSILKFANSMPGLISKILILLLILVYFASNWDSTIGLFKTVFVNFLYGKVFLFFQNRIRHVMNEELIKDEYIEWQRVVCASIYLPLILKSKKNNKDIKITSLEIKSEDDYRTIKTSRYFESYTWTVKSVEYPFQSICDKSELKYLDTGDFDKNHKSFDDYLVNKDLTKEEKIMAWRYNNIMSPTIHFPDRIGYMLDGMETDDDANFHIRSHVGVYKSNIIESHVLEYELLRFYKKNFKQISSSNRSYISDYKKCQRIINSYFEDKSISDNDLNVINKFKKRCLSDMPLRNKIHNKIIANYGDESEIFFQGDGRESLIGVQIFVLLKNHSDSYDCLRMRRSEKVSAKAGYLQFIPSGGFEAFNADRSRDAQWTNYSLNKVLFREMTEECFGTPDSSRNDKFIPESVYTHKDIYKILEMLDKADGIEYEFLGITESLVGLRPELSFILKIDSEELINDIVANEESSSSISLIEIKKLEDPRFWTYDNDPKDLTRLNCTSAGLFELARKSNIYQKCLKNQIEINNKNNC